MAEELPELRDIVERNAQAVMTGNLMQLMADITPEALAKLMQMAPAGGQPSIASMPAITGYSIEHLGEPVESHVEPGGDTQRYRATFTSDSATAKFVTTWKQVLGQWKVVDFSEVELTTSGDSPGP